eukprot:TRINITY_DN1973_c0_g1_i1.p1 TRINITY_DN1973_c0_g1~~TRINITY_DN1973_c0_g1_i1.p1  ORF type:complete len:207 (+),score=95.77 TRINITY_DN1973_c0_g1_i1:436-1056(+)
MKCFGCANPLVIQTDPKGCDYELVQGCERKVEEWDSSKVGNVEYKPDETKKLSEDAFYRLENSAVDDLRGEEELPRLQRLIEQKKGEKDDYDLNARLRKEMRAKKADEKSGVKKMKCLDEEVALARSVHFGGVDKYRLNRYKKREIIRNESIFAQKTEKAAELERLRQKLSTLPKVAQRILIKEQKPMQNWNQINVKITPMSKKNL